MQRHRQLLTHLLQDERVAVAAYRALEESFQDPLAAAELRRIERDHEDALNLIESQAADLWEETEEGGGVWRAWAPAIEAGAHHAGAEQVLEDLAQGERHEIGELKEALADDALPFELQELVGSRLLPKTAARLDALERLRQRI